MGRLVSAKGGGKVRATSPGAVTRLDKKVPGVSAAKFWKLKPARRGKGMLVELVESTHANPSWPSVSGLRSAGVRGGQSDAETKLRVRGSTAQRENYYLVPTNDGSTAVRVPTLPVVLQMLPGLQFNRRQQPQPSATQRVVTGAARRKGRGFQGG